MSIEFINSGLTAKAYYRFESGALTTDSSGEGHTLTAIGTPAETTGKFGGGVLFQEELDKEYGDGATELPFATSYWRAQPFVPTAVNLYYIKLKLKKVGSPTGNLTIEIQSDTAGAPSGTVLATTTLGVTTLTTSYVVYTIQIPAVTLVSGTKYHCCLKGASGWDGSNDISWIGDTGETLKGLHGAGNFGTTSSAGFYLKTYSFKSGYSAVDHADLKPTGVFSIGGWVKKTPYAALAKIFASHSQNTNRAGIELGINSTGQKATLVSAKNTGTVSGTDFQVITGDTSIDDGELHFVVSAWDGSYLRMYVDGEEDATPVAWSDAPAYAATNYVRIGCMNNAGVDGFFFPGTFDEGFFLNGVALSAQQIKTLYSSHIMPVTVGSFALTGIDTVFTKSLHMIMETGSFILTGINALFNKGYNLVAGAGSFILTGQNALFNKGYNLICSVGSFTLTGIDMVFSRSMSMLCETGSFILTGIVATFKKYLAGIWEAREKPTTNWGNRTKPTTNWSSREKPTTNWTPRVKP